MATNVNKKKNALLLKQWSLRKVRILDFILLFKLCRDSPVLSPGHAEFIHNQQTYKSSWGIV